MTGSKRKEEDEKLFKGQWLTSSWCHARPRHCVCLCIRFVLFHCSSSSSITHSASCSLDPFFCSGCHTILLLIVAADRVNAFLCECWQKQQQSCAPVCFQAVRTKDLGEGGGCFFHVSSSIYLQATVVVSPKRHHWPPFFPLCLLLSRTSRFPSPSATLRLILRCLREIRNIACHFSYTRPDSIEMVQRSWHRN